ncbi:uncharacterized protein KIAA1755 homolog isoform X2 [Pelodiscus sinensis]|uniref:uncharacterized protein KIAA1755 homolog isoform X2 n=1 Tax=Pelodiscus sinensis TaxID=13735 RepID=UPI003F6B79EA
MQPGPLLPQPGLTATFLGRLDFIAELPEEPRAACTDGRERGGGTRGTRKTSSLPGERLVPFLLSPASPSHMDPRSLDVAVQKALLSLYPPFDVTAPTVLSQLFRLLDSDYHGDGLCCLLDFLIPAKRLFERVRQAACAPYLNCIFLHEGWPLCLHEKVVVHLAPLNPLLLRPGDFYLQAEPYGEQSACLTVKCLSRDLRTVEERLVPESSHALLFTSHWLEEVNHALSGAPLHTCLVATEKGVAPLPWSQIATPEFIHKPTVAPGPTQLGASLLAHALGLSSAAVPEDPASQSGTGSLGLADAPRLHGNIPGTVLDGQDGPERSGQGKYPGLIKVDQASPRKKPSAFVVPSPCDREGDYVDLLEWTEEVKLEHLATSGPSHGQPGPSGETPVSSASKPRLPTGTRGTAAEKWPGGKGQSSEEGPCTPRLRRKLPRDPKVPGLRCRYRESYVAAIRNPVNLGSGLMAAILEESHVPRQAFPVAGRPRENPAPAMQGLDQAAAPRLLSGFPRKAEPQATNAEEGTRQGYSKLLRSPAGAVRNLPRSQSPPASHKFSFFKGQRQAAAPGAGVSGASQHEGPRKRMSALYSPRVSRAKAAGKGADQTDGSLGDVGSRQGTGWMNGLCAAEGSCPARERPSAESSPQELLHWQDLHPELLLSGLACLPGSTDKLGRALIQVSTSSSAWEATWCSAPAVAQLLLYLCSIPRRDARARGLTVLVDARRQPPAPALHAAIRAVQSAAPASIRGVLLLAEREAAAHLEKFPGMQVEVLPSLRALGRHVDRTQLTPDLDGTFPYCHDEWVQFFQKLHPFVADLQQASKLLQSSIQELEEGDLPADSQGAGECAARYRALMEAVLSNVQLVGLQREGGATLARLRKEAARLGFSPDIRNSLDSALGLYSRVEEDVHALVTKSNRCLERLELLRQIRELEAEFSKLSCWLEEGDSQLRELSSEEWNPQNPESSSQRFKEFFLQATAHCSRGLELCQATAALQGSASPEADALQAARGALQARLPGFYARVERQQAELRALLRRFRHETTWLSLDCKHLGEGQPACREALRRLEETLEKLSVAFPAERFQELKAEAHPMHRGRGLAVWNEAWPKGQDTRQTLEEMLETPQEADCGGEEGSSSSAATRPGPRVPRQDPHVSKAASDPAQASAESKAHATEPGCGARRGARLPPDSDLSVAPRGPGGSRGGPSFCRRREAREGGRISHGSVTAEACPPSVAHGADLEQRDVLAEDPGTDGLHAAPSQDPPLALPSQACCPDTSQHLRDGASRSPGDGPCPAPSMPRQPRGGTVPEAAPYFQVTRRGSFSSKDTEPGNPSGDPAAPHLILPLERTSPRLPRPLGTVCLESSRTNMNPE